MSRNMWQYHISWIIKHFTLKWETTDFCFHTNYTLRVYAQLLRAWLGILGGKPNILDQRLILMNHGKIVLFNGAYNFRRDEKTGSQGEEKADLPSQIIRINPDKHQEQISQPDHIHNTCYVSLYGKGHCLLLCQSKMGAQQNFVLFNLFGLVYWFVCDNKSSLRPRLATNLIYRLPSFVFWVLRLWACP